MVARTGLFVAPLPGSTPAGTSPTDGRLVLGALYGSGSIGASMSGNSWSASATAMQLTVGSSVWRIPDPSNSLACFISPADPYTFTLAAGPASGSRIDVLWVKQDNFENGDADSRVTYGIAQGVAASSPAAPAIPAGAMKIATVTVPQGASNAGACTVVYAFNQTVAPPSVIYGAATGLGSIAGAHYGQRAYLPGSTLEYRWNGNAWRAWESDWTVNNGTWSGLVGVAESAPGWLRRGRYRYASGKIRYEFATVLNGGGAGSNGAITLSLPVTADMTDPGIGTGPFQAATATLGRASYVQASTGRWYDWAISFWDTSGNTIAFRAANSALYMDGQGAGSGYGPGDIIRGVLEYDPA